MSRTYLILLATIFFFLSGPSLAANAAETPQAGEVFPEISLPVPEEPDKQRYLGLSATQDTFELSQIKSELLIIEIFNMYCPHCQREAPKINRLYQKIEDNNKLREKIKMIGIGVGNSEYEVNVFKEKYDVLFPLFPDRDYTIHKKCGEVFTPHFFVLELKEQGSNKVIYSQRGGIDDLDAFLEEISTLSP
jgi:peroxiredoxin